MDHIMYANELTPDMLAKAEAWFKSHDMDYTVKVEQINRPVQFSIFAKAPVKFIIRHSANFQWTVYGRVSA